MKIKSYFYGLDLISQAPWRVNDTPIFYTGILEDGTPFTTKLSSAGFGDSVSPAYIKIDGKEIHISTKELLSLLADAEQTISPIEQKMAEIVNNKPFWSIITGLRCGEWRWGLFCPHGYEKGRECPICQEYPHEELTKIANIVAVFTIEKNLQPFIIYSLPEAQEIMFPDFSKYMDKTSPNWGRYPENKPYHY